MRILIVAITIAVLLPLAAKSSDSLLDMFSKETDEFSGDVFYYPARLKPSNKDLAKSQKGTWRDENPSIYVRQFAEGGCEFNIDCILLLKHEDIEGKIYIIADEEKYTLDVEDSDVEVEAIDKTDRKAFSRHFGERVTLYRETYKLCSRNLTDEVQHALASAKAMRIRIGDKDEVNLKDPKPQDIKDCLLLYKLLSTEAPLSKGLIK